MKTSFIASIIGAAVLVAAQTPDLSALPACALTCAGSITNVPGCSAGDFACVCKNDSFISGVSTCIKGACTNPDDLAKAITVAQSLCGSNLPSGAVSSLTSSPTGNATTGSGSSGNSTTKPTSTGSGSSSSSTGASSNSAAGLLPGGFAVAAIFAGLLTL